jgi:hypothetical protein
MSAQCSNPPALPLQLIRHRVANNSGRTGNMSHPLSLLEKVI